MKRSTGIGCPPMTVWPTTRLVRAGFLTAPLLAEPLPHERCPQSFVWSVRPAVTEQHGPNRIRFARLQHLLLVVRVSARFGAGQKPRAEPGGLCAQRQDGDQTSSVGHAA